AIGSGVRLDRHVEPAGTGERGQWTGLEGERTLCGHARAVERPRQQVAFERDAEHARELRTASARELRWLAAIVGRRVEVVVRTDREHDWRPRRGGGQREG